MNWIDWDITQGLMRHGLTVLAGWLISQGYLSSDSGSAFVGAVLMIVGVIWSVINKRQHKAALVSATSSLDNIK